MAYRWEFDKLVLEIDALQSRAHEIGMHVTGHALNRAKNVCGWEFSGDIEQAAKAAKGDSVEYDRGSEQS